LLTTVKNFNLKNENIVFQVYMGHEICADMFPFSWTAYTFSHYEKLTMNLWGMSLWVFIAFILYKKRIFLAI
jgi:heparan-alpha-glucosaminide N-acetyltransferase